MVKGHGYTSSSPNTMWINVVHRYNRGSGMTIKSHNTIKDTRQAACFIMRGLAIIWKLLCDIQTITEKEDTAKKIISLIQRPINVLSYFA